MEHEKQSQEVHLIARGVIIKEGKLLLCRNVGKEHYYLPGGHVEFKEPVKVALVRELQEELGLSATIIRFLGVQEYSFDTGGKLKCHVHEINFYFEVAIPELSTDKNPSSPEAHQNFEWCSLELLSTKLLLPQGIDKLLRELLHKDYNEAFKEG